MSARFFIPRRRYFQSLRIARQCPEIRAHVDRIAILTAAEAIKLSIALPFMALGLLLEWAGDAIAKPFRMLPDFDAWRLEVLREAHSIVPVEEIRRRALSHKEGRDG